MILIVFDFELVNLLCEHTNCFTCWQFFALSCDWQSAEITLTFYNTLKFHTWQLIYTEVRENVCMSLCVFVWEKERERRKTHLHVRMQLHNSWLTAHTPERRQTDMGEKWGILKEDRTSQSLGVTGQFGFSSAIHFDLGFWVVDKTFFLYKYLYI